MSLKAMTCAMAMRGVSSSEKLLLLALANYADENMGCYPSQKRLADDTCLSDRTIRALLITLEERKIISRTERHRPDGSRSTDLITLHFAGLVTEGGAETISGGAEITSGGVRKSLPGGAEITSALTTFEPVKEPIKSEADDLAELVWSEANQASRNRSGRPATRRAVSAAINKRATPASLLSSVREHCRKSGDHAKGVHRIIEAELWREYLAKPAQPPPTDTDPAFRAHCERHYAMTGEWRPEWGEKPRRAA